MLIDLSTSIVIGFSVCIAALTAAFNVRISKDLTNKKKHYYIIVSATIIAFFIIGILHYWDAFNCFLDDALSFLSHVLSDIGSKLISFNPALNDLLRDFGLKVLLLCGLFPWTPLYYTIIRSSKKYHIITSSGIIFYLVFLPALTIFLEFKFSIWLFSFLCSSDAIVHIIWIAPLILCVHLLFVKFMIISK